MENGRTTDDIYQVLQNEIISLALKPGEELSENALCRRFGVSRTPIRTVLQRLENKGFVSIAPYKGSFVTLLNYTTIDQNIYARVAIETMVLRDFIHTHRPAEHALEVNGQSARRIVLGDWDQQGWALQIDEQGLHQAPFALA